MSPLRLVILAVAAAAAIMAALLVRNLAAPTAGSNTAAPVERIVEVEVDQVKVLVAATDLPLGHQLSPEDLNWVSWPERTVTPDYYTEEAQRDALAELTGSVVRSPLYRGEPLMPQKVVGRGETGVMAALLDPGLRAVSVEIAPETASAGFILPDDRVDVILTRRVPDPDGQDRTVTRTILENARILAIDQTLSAAEEDPSMLGSIATLELSPKQAELIAMAQRSGEISLALRSAADAGFNDGKARATVDMMEGIDPDAPRITVYRRGKATTEGS